MWYNPHIGIVGPSGAGNTPGRGTDVKGHAMRSQYICATCGLSIVGWTGRPRRYCSQACYRAGSLADRFWSKVQKADGCWLWTGAKSKNGYGQFMAGGCQTGAHRVAYEWLVGVVPDGMVLDHLCRNRACVNPTHLEAVTQRDNMRRGISPSALKHERRMREGACSRGHLITAETWDSGHRRCRVCHREDSLARYYRRAGSKRP